MKKISKNVVMWDWDGTIINNHASALKALQEMADKYGLPRVTEDDLRNVMGAFRGAYWTLNFGDKAEEPYRFFIRRFEEYNLEKVPQPFDGIREALAYVQKTGTPQVVLSNMPQAMLDEECDRSGLRHYFENVRGLGVGEKDRKPYREQVEKAIGDLPYDALIMIGDGESDMMTAANVGAIGIYVTRHPAQGLAYDYLVEAHHKILPILKEILEEK